MAALEGALENIRDMHAAIDVDPNFCERCTTQWPRTTHNIAAAALEATALTTKLAAAERHTQEVIADCDEYQRTVGALRGQLAAAEAVVEAAGSVSSSAGAHFRCPLCDKNGYGHRESCRLRLLNNALATYRATPGDTDGT